MTMASSAQPEAQPERDRERAGEDAGHRDLRREPDGEQPRRACRSAGLHRSGRCRGSRPPDLRTGWAGDREKQARRVRLLPPDRVPCTLPSSEELTIASRGRAGRSTTAVRQIGVRERGLSTGVLVVDWCGRVSGAELEFEYAFEQGAGSRRGDGPHRGLSRRGGRAGFPAARSAGHPELPRPAVLDTTEAVRRQTPVIEHAALNALTAHATREQVGGSVKRYLADPLRIDPAEAHRRIADAELLSPRRTLTRGTLGAGLGGHR